MRDTIAQMKALCTP